MTAFAAAAARAFATGGSTADAWARAVAAAIAQFGCDQIRPVLAREHLSPFPSPFHARVLCCIRLQQKCLSAQACDRPDTWDCIPTYLERIFNGW